MKKEQVLQIIMVASIAIFTFVWMISYLVVKYDGIIYFSRGKKKINRKNMMKLKNLSFLAIIFISLLFVFYNMYITETSVMLGSDRTNYAAYFKYMRGTSSIGLDIVMSYVRFLEKDIYFLFYLTTFLFIAVTLYAYRCCEDATPLAFLLLLQTGFGYFSFTALKQCYTAAIASLFFVIVLKERTLKNDIVCFLLLLLAVLFHPTGFILIPIYFMIRMQRNRRNIMLYISGIIIFGVFFRQIIVMIGQFVEVVIPSLSMKIAEYFGSEDSGNLEIRVTFLKGIPYYFITLYGIVRRKKFLHNIQNYDNYLIISLTASMLYMVSVYTYWFNRFINLFSFIILVYFAKMIKNEKYQGNRILCALFVGGSLSFLTYRDLYLIYTMWGGF